MIENPIWVWVVSILGVIAAGIGLGYLIIFLFWKIEQYFSSPPAVSTAVHEEEQVEEPAVITEPYEEPAENLEPAATLSQNEVQKETKEEPIPVMSESISDEENRFIKFTTVLHARFNHPFAQVNTIVCWDIGLENGDEVRDSGGNVMKFRVIESPSEPKATRSLLVDETEQKTIRVISVKEYMKRESNIDVDKMKLL